MIEEGGEVVLVRCSHKNDKILERLRECGTEYDQHRQSA